MTDVVWVKSENILYLVLYRKGLQIPCLGYVSNFNLEDGWKECGFKYHPSTMNY